MSKLALLVVENSKRRGECEAVSSFEQERPTSLGRVRVPIICRPER